MRESTEAVVTHIQKIIDLKNTKLLGLEPTFTTTSGKCFGSEVMKLNYEIIRLKHILDSFKIVMECD